jgi:RNA recognition motif-containing protein
MVVRNLSPEMTAERLSRLFSVHGAVRSVRLATDVMTGRCSGIAYVSLDELRTGAALDALDRSRLGGRLISVTMERKTIPAARRVD